MIDYQDDSAYSETTVSDTGCCCCDTSATEAAWVYDTPTAEPFVPVADEWSLPEPTPVAPVALDPAVAYVEPVPAPVTLDPAVAYVEPVPAPVVEAPAVVAPVAPEPAVVTPADLYPSTMTIGGNPGDDFTIVNTDGTPADLYPTTMTIGGNPGDDFTIVNADGSPADVSMTATVGPSDPNSLPNTLAKLYGLAAANGDVMSQIMINDIINSQANTTALWLYHNPVWVNR